MKWIGLVIAIFVAAIAAYMVLKFSGEGSAGGQKPVQVSDRAAPQVEAVNVYVASNFIPIGSIIEENMLTVQPWPKHLVLPGFVVGAEEGKKLIGQVTRSPFQANEPIILTKIVNPQDPNFLAGDLPKGMRVVTMATNEIAGVAGFIFPGDRVDVIINHKILKEGVTATDLQDEKINQDDLYETVAETLLTNIRVLAVDQRASGGLNKDGGIIIPKSVSLEVTPEDAQRVALARKAGDLSVALRSIKDKDTIEKVAITREPDLSQFDMSTLKTKPGSSSHVKVIRGIEMQTVEQEDDAEKKANEKVQSEERAKE